MYSVSRLDTKYRTIVLTEETVSQYSPVTYDEKYVSGGQSQRREATAERYAFYYYYYYYYL